MFEIRSFEAEAYLFSDNCDPMEAHEAIIAASNSLLDTFPYVVLAGGFDTVEDMWNHVDLWLPQLDDLQEEINDWQAYDWCDETSSMLMVKIAVV